MGAIGTIGAYHRRGYDLTGNQAIGGNGGSAAAPRGLRHLLRHGGGLFTERGTVVVRGTRSRTIRPSVVRRERPFGRGVGTAARGPPNVNGDPRSRTAPSLATRRLAATRAECRGGSGAFIVGWGLGGAITNEGWNRANGTRLTASNLTLTHNRAVGGGGNSGNALAGAGVGGGLISWWVGAATTISGSTISHNHAIGGDGADGLGGGLANFFGSAATLVGCTLDHNLALGGNGADGGNGGNGYGGGVYNEAGAFDVASSLRLERSTVTKNHANGGEGSTGGSDGEGSGGGGYNLGLFDLDELSLIVANHASTSHDDAFDI